MKRRAPWLDDRDAGRGFSPGLIPLDLLAPPYALGARLHRAYYETGLGRRRRLPCRVVSVGGITVGGSGKTPLAAAVAVGLRARGHRVALASRGYGRLRNAGVTPVSDGQRLEGFDPEARGDEPLVLAAGAPGVPVVVGPDREKVGLRAIAFYGTEILVLDDGFQHHRLARDVDVVGLDGRFGLGNGRLLPRGPLREPVSALSRADALVMLDGPLAEPDASRILEQTPRVSRFLANRKVLSVTSLAANESLDQSSLEGERVGLLSGIAHPSSFRKTVEALGAEVVAERRFPDHHRYRPRDLAGLSKEAPLWLTTEKDGVKILSSWGGSEHIRVVRSRVLLEDESGFFDWLESRLLPAPEPG